RAVDVGDERIELTSVGVALDADVDQIQALLGGIGHVAREDDRAGTRAEDRVPRRGEGPERRLPGLGLEELPQRRGLAAGERQARGLLEIFRPFGLEALDADLSEGPAMRLEVSLEREDGDAPAILPARLHHPRVWSWASSARLAASMPFIPEPSDSSAA